MAMGPRLILAERYSARSDRSTTAVVFSMRCRSHSTRLGAFASPANHQ